MVMEIKSKTILGNLDIQESSYGQYMDYAGLTYTDELLGTSLTVNGDGSYVNTITADFCELTASMNTDVTCTCMKLGVSASNAGEVGIVEVFPEGVFLRDYTKPFSLTITYSANGGGAGSWARALVGGNITSVALAAGAASVSCILSYDGTNYDVMWGATLISRNDNFKFNLTTGGEYKPAASITPTKIVVTSGPVLFLRYTKP